MLGLNVVPLAHESVEDATRDDDDVYHYICQRLKHAASMAPSASATIIRSCAVCEGSAVATG